MIECDTKINGEKEKRMCPNDADPFSYEGKHCSEKSPDGYGCTRKKGHKGKHHAHGGSICCKIW